MATQSAELISQWCAYQRMRNLSKRTIIRRRWSLTRLAQRGPLAMCTTVDIEAWAAAFADVQTRFCVLSDVRLFYRWATRRGHLPVDPTIDIELPRVPKRLPRPFSTENVRRLLGATSGEDHLIILLGCHAGLRVSEIANLRRDDVVDGRIEVRAGKGAKDRTVPASPELLDAVTAQHLPALAAIFPTLTSGKSVSSRIRTHLHRLDIPGRPHDLRHSFGTELATRGVPIERIAQLMGHANLETTRGYILLASPDRKVVHGLYTGSAA